jgi:hypothetical protein
MIHGPYNIKYFVSFFRLLQFKKNNEKSQIVKVKKKPTCVDVRQ